MQTVVSFRILLVRSKVFAYFVSHSDLFILQHDCLSAPSFMALPACVFMEP